MRNLDDLAAYTQMLAKKFPIIAGSLEVKRGGFSDKDVAALPSYLPPVYLQCVKNINVEGASIGQFEIWPCLGFDKSFLGSFNCANSKSQCWSDLVEAEKLVVIGFYEGDPICVGRRGTASEDQVFMIDISTSPTLRVVDVAVDFEAFLLLAGNLMYLCDEFEGKDPERGLVEMKEFTSVFGCTKRQSQFWMGVSELLMY